MVSLPRWLSWLGQMLGCVIKGHGLGFESYYWLNILIYPVLVVVGVVNTPSFGSP